MDAYPELAVDPTDEELARDWTLSAGDLDEVHRCRGDDNRHRFAVQLCALRVLGRFVDDFTIVPVRIANHIGRQIGRPPVLYIRPPTGAQPPTSTRSACVPTSAIRRSTRSGSSAGSTRARSQASRAPRCSMVHCVPSEAGRSKLRRVRRWSVLFARRPRVARRERGRGWQPRSRQRAAGHARIRGDSRNRHPVTTARGGEMRGSPGTAGITRSACAVVLRFAGAIARSDRADRALLPRRVRCGRAGTDAEHLCKEHLVRAWICNLIVAVLMVGCTTTNTEPGAEHQGVVELHVDTRPFLTVPITRVTVEAAGQTQDLPLNPATGTFDGLLFLPAGTQSLIARAFGGDMLVGESQLTPVQVTPGTTTRVLLRIIDRTGTAGQAYGPILDSLSFPTTTDAGTTVTFTVAVVAPHGDPVTYAWSADCMDSTFTAPSAASTGWSKAAQGTCTITVAATSNGFTIAQSFGIVVFPAGANIGAVDVGATFIASPSVFLSLGAVGCNVGAGNNGSCPRTIASPAVSSYDVTVASWGGSTPGTLDVSDSCGGRFGISSRGDSNVNGFWLPPVGGGLCFVTAHAVSGDGLSATVTAAVLTHPGTAATARPPVPSVFFETGCPFGGAAMPADCGSLQAGSQRTAFGNVFWDDGHPGSLTISDDCAGPQPDVSSPLFFFSTTWLTPNMAGATCTTRVRATNLEGAVTESAALYHLITPGG